MFSHLIFPCFRTRWLNPTPSFLSFFKSYFSETLLWKMALSFLVNYYHIRLFISFIDFNLIWNYLIYLSVDCLLPVFPLLCSRLYIRERDLRFSNLNHVNNIYLQWSYRTMKITDIWQIITKVITKRAV